MVYVYIYISNVYLLLTPGIYLGKARWHWTAIATWILICHVPLFMWNACSIQDEITPSATEDKKPPMSYPSHLWEGMGQGRHCSALPCSAPLHLCLRSWYFGDPEDGSGCYWSPLTCFHWAFPIHGSDNAHAPCKSPPLQWRTGQTSPRRLLSSWWMKVSHMIMWSCRPSAGPLRSGNYSHSFRNSAHKRFISLSWGKHSSGNVSILSFLLNNNFLQIFMICSQGGTKNSSFFPSPQALF